MSARLLATAGALLSLLVPRVIDACSCAHPSPQLWAPLDTSPAPFDTRVTVAVPKTVPSEGVLLRPVGGQAIPRSLSRHPSGAFDMLVLTPEQPLPKGQRFEVAVVDPDHHPQTLVFGTFATGDDEDDDAPTLGPVGQVSYHAEVVSPKTSCASLERWLEIPLGGADDPHRPQATLLFGVWLSSTGKIDPKAPPTYVLPQRDDVVVIGRQHRCSHLGAELPSGPAKVAIGIASIDEAGNQSPMQRRSVLISKGPKKP